MFGFIREWLENRELERSIDSQCIIESGSRSYSLDAIDEFCDYMGYSDTNRGLLKGFALFSSKRMYDDD